MSPSTNIVLNAIGFSADKGLTQKAGCCITMEFDDEYGRKSTRMITHPIGNATVRRANLQAVHLALAAVVRPMRKIADVMVVCPEDIKNILDNPAHPEEADNTDVIGEIRKWITFYTRLRFVSWSVESIPGYDKARECAESQSGSDTGTVV